MLSKLDEMPWHQVATTFDHADTSDPRFYDRHWYAIYDPAGNGALQMTLGIYKNMNVADGAIVVIVDGKQYNVRASRSLHPEFDFKCGPLSIDVIEPFRQIRITIEPGEHLVSGELMFTSTLDPEEEKHHFERQDGRIVHNWARYDQLGECSGWLDVDGKRVELDRWWTGRDHSWGVRPGMGVPEPVTTDAAKLAATQNDKSQILFKPDEAFFYLHLFFTSAELAGNLVAVYNGGRKERFGGVVHDPRQSGTHQEANATAMRLRMFEGTNRFSHAEIDLEMADGSTATLLAEAVGPSIVMGGLGYSGGYDDGQGLGAYRGQNHLESDVYGVEHPEKVVMPDGTVQAPKHRLAPVQIAVQGGIAEQGCGSLTVVFDGDFPGEISEIK